MKFQDVTFWVVFLFVFWRRHYRLAVWLGLGSLVLAIPLFAFKMALFTAERLIWYAAAFFAYSAVYQLIKLKKKK